MDKNKRKIITFVMLLIIISIAFIGYNYKINTFSFALPGRTDIYAPHIIRGILETGYPQIGDDAYYLRGATYYYPSAMMVNIFGMNEFSLRIVNVFYMLGTLVITFLLSKSLFGQKLGLLATIVSAFLAGQASSVMIVKHWPAVQFFFMMTTYLFYRTYIIKNLKYGSALIVLSSILLLITDNSVFVIVTFIYLAVLLILKKYINAIKWSTTGLLLALMIVVGVCSVPLFSEYHIINQSGEGSSGVSFTNFGFIHNVLSNKHCMRILAIWIPLCLGMFVLAIRTAKSVYASGEKRFDTYFFYGILFLCVVLSSALMAVQALILLFSYYIYKNDSAFLKSLKENRTFNLFLWGLFAFFIPSIFALYRINPGMEIFASEPLRGHPLGAFILLQGVVIESSPLFFILLLSAILYFGGSSISKKLPLNERKNRSLLFLLLLFYTGLFSTLGFLSYYPTYPHNLIVVYPILGIIFTIFFYDLSGFLIKLIAKSESKFSYNYQRFIVCLVLCAAFLSIYGYPRYYRWLNFHSSEMNLSVVVEKVKKMIKSDDKIISIGNNQGLSPHFSEVITIWDRPWNAQRFSDGKNGFKLLWWNPEVYPEKLKELITFTEAHGNKVILFIFGNTPSRWNDREYNSPNTIKYLFEHYKLEPIAIEKQVGAYQIKHIQNL